MIPVAILGLEEARRKPMLPFLGLVWAVAMRYFFSAEATVCTLDLLYFLEVRQRGPYSTVAGVNALAMRRKSVIAAGEAIANQTKS
jgi:hypothetical protein